MVRLYKVFGSFFAVATAGLGLLVWSRTKLPYTIEGSYFDEASLVVYQQDAVVGYSALMLGSLLLTAFFAYFGFRKGSGTLKS